MYIATFDTPEGAIVQGMVRLPTLPRLAADERAVWWQTFQQLVRGIHGINLTGASLRLMLNPGASLNRVLFASAPAERVMQLRRFFASFTRLEALVSGSAELPLSREEYDVVADDFPALRCLVATPNYRAGTVWFACDFRVSPLLDSLLIEADAYGYRLGYQMNLRPLTLNRDVMRAARVNALAVEDVAGVSDALAAQQRRLAVQLTHATAICDEFLGVDPGPAAEWLADSLRRHFRSQFGVLGFEAPSWRFLEWDYDEELACPSFNPTTDIPVDEICACAVDDAQVIELLGRRSSDLLANRSEVEPSSEGVEVLNVPVPVEGLPNPYSGNDSFVFVSYKRKDLALVAPLMLHLQHTGWNLWYDRGIPGGAEWHAMLEERLSACTAVVLFVSQAAVDSKYVRREVQFADSLNKPIIAVELETARLRRGMGLLLNQYQMISKNAQDCFTQLSQALDRIGAAGCCAPTG
jgi:hypothetical protein